MKVNRRRMMALSAAAAAATSTARPGRSALAKEATIPAAAPKYRRYEVHSPEGQAQLASYARAIERMVALPPEHPHNWFRYSFIHFMDCPHGNWWFYIWHRGYIGYFEQIIRRYSDDPKFTLPYWDWTVSPRIPDSMFKGVLTPVDGAYLPYTKDLDTFTKFIQPPLKSYYNSLDKAQRAQLNDRGYSTFDLLWNDVTGYDPKTGKVIPGNMGFATTAMARYLSPSNPNLDADTTNACSPDVVTVGLSPIAFYNKVAAASFTSSMTANHSVMPINAQFSVIEGQPHNLVHNCIGGVRPNYNGPYGFMTNFLSPADPVFFLHHANCDRLWDVWTRKQQSIGKPILPTDAAQRKAFLEEPFRFFVDAAGNYLINAKAADYFSTASFDYDYAPGFGSTPNAMVNRVAALPKLAAGKVRDGIGQVALGAAQSDNLVAQITVTRRPGPDAPRQYTILVNAPEGVTSAEPGSPYYGGTIGFFGPSMSGMPHDATFAVPLHQAPVRKMMATKAGANASTQVQLKLVPSDGTAAPPLPIKALSIQAL